MALKTPEFLVSVSANLNFKSEGMPRDMEVWGNFWSGDGHYMLIPIQSITGDFHNKGRHLSFSDVKVNTKITTISTNVIFASSGGAIASVMLWATNSEYVWIKPIWSVARSILCLPMMTFRPRRAQQLSRPISVVKRRKRTGANANEISHFGALFFTMKSSETVTLVALFRCV